MKTIIVAALMTPVVVLLGIMPAAAQTGPNEVAGPEDGVRCEVDIGVIPNLPQEFVNNQDSLSFLADHATLQCTGSAPNQTLQLRCLKQLTGWPTGATVSSFKNFDCEVFDGVCTTGTGSFAFADNNNIKIDSNGLVELFCVRNKKS